MKRNPSLFALALVASSLSAQDVLLQPLAITFAGQANTQLLVRNLENRLSEDALLSGSSTVAAQAFTSGATPVVPRAISLRLKRYPLAFGAPSVRVKLWSGAGNAPVTELLDLGTASVTSTNEENVVWTAAPGTAPTLSPNTRYWVTARSESPASPCWWGVSTNSAYTGSGALSTARAVSTDSGATWADASDGRVHLLQVTGASPFIVTNTNDAGPGSLRRALADAHAFPGADTITFDPSLSGQTITLTGYEWPPGFDFSIMALVVTSEVTVDATALPGGLSLSGGGTMSILFVSDGAKLSLHGLTLRDGIGAHYYCCPIAGAITNRGGTLALSRCTFTRNKARIGAAIVSNTESISDSITSSTTVDHCTISGNQASFYGGALLNYHGRTTLLHCTLTDNADTLYSASLVSSPDELTETRVQNSVIDGYVSTLPSPFYPHNSFSSQGHNLVGDGDAVGAFNQPGDRMGFPFHLAPLGDYGGSTRTCPPLPASPAFDAAAPAGGSVLDQRGFPRVSGLAPDIGAVELQEIRVTTPVDENDGVAAGGISLREAIAASRPGVAEVVRFAPSVFNATLPATNTVTLHDEITVTAGVAIDGSDIPAGMTIHSGVGLNRIFTVDSGSTVLLQGLTLSGGRGGGGVSDGLGGAVLNRGDLTVRRCALTGNNGPFGGAIFNESGATLSLSHCTLFGNGTANSATQEGGALYNRGTASLTHCTVSGNSAVSAGGLTSGLINVGGTLDLANCILAGNTGGDVHVHSGMLSLIGNSVVGSPITNSGELYSPGTAIVTDPRLAPPGLYGGTSLVLPPLANSPAIDAAFSLGGFSSDQRGFPAPSGPAPDIGAVELQEIRVNTLSDQNDGLGLNQVSLREALTSTAPGVAEVVRFAPSVFNGPNTIRLGGAISVTRSVRVDATDLPKGVIVDGALQGFRLLDLRAGGNLALQGLTLVNGSTSLDGGSIFNNFGTLTLTGCTFSGNQADYGGAVYNKTDSNGSAFSTGTTLDHCTLSGNRAVGFGGALFNHSGRMTLTHCTVSGNYAASMGGGVFCNGETNARVSATGCIIAGNEGRDVEFLPSDVTSPFVSFGDNLIGVGNALGAFNQAGDLVNTVPRLAPLADYGGPTWTMPPVPGSPAIDAADGSSASVDQRGLPRPSGSAREIGSVEFQGRDDLARFWNTDWDGDGLPYGVDQAVPGGDPLVAGDARLALPRLTFAQGVPNARFGLNPRARDQSQWILERATSLTPPNFQEIFRYAGPSGGVTQEAGNGSVIGIDTLDVQDANPPAPVGFYRLRVELAP